VHLLVFCQKKSYFPHKNINLLNPGCDLPSFCVLQTYQRRHRWITSQTRRVAARPRATTRTQTGECSALKLAPSSTALTFVCHVHSYRLQFGPGGAVPVLPVRNNLRRPNSSHFPQSSRSFQFRKGLASKCSWKCTAIVFIILCVVLTAALTYMFGEYIFILKLFIWILSVFRCFYYIYI